MPGVSGNKPATPQKTAVADEPMFEEETPETVEEIPTETVEEVPTEIEQPKAVDEKPYETVDTEPAPDSVIPSEAKNPAGANADLNTGDPEIDPETVEEEPTEIEETEAVDEKPYEAVDTEPATDTVILSEAKNPAGANADLNTGEPEIDPETIEEETVETANDKSDETARFKAATDGFDRLEKFTFKIFKDVLGGMLGVNVTARQTVADLLLFIAAKCKNAGKIIDFKRAFNISKDFGILPQSAANYVPLLINLTAKLKNGGGFTSGVFNELRGILSNIICDETAVDFELKIFKQVIGV